MRPGEKDTVTSAPPSGGILHSGATCQHDQVCQRDSLAVRLRAVEVLETAFHLAASTVGCQLGRLD
jgi:hypothetical protein